jgi:hypothetical protein
MKENKITLKSNLTKVDNHVLGASDYSEIPELPEEFFTKGQLYSNGQAVERRTQGKQKRLKKKNTSLCLNHTVITKASAASNPIS